MRRAVVSFLIIAIFGSIVMIACESSSPPSPDANIDIQDSIVLAGIGGIVDERAFSASLQALDMSFALIDSIPGSQATSKSRLSDSRSAGDINVLVSSVSSYTYSNGWHIFEFEADLSGDSVTSAGTISGIDSLKVFVGADPVQIVLDETEIDSIKTRAYLAFTDIADSATGAMAHLIDVAFARSATDTLVTINGTTDDSIYVHATDSISTCEFMVSIDQIISGLVLSLNGDGCPEAGTVQMSVAILLGCTSTEPGGNPFDLAISGSWDITAIVNDNGTITSHYYDGNSNYTTTEPCEPGPALTSSWWEIPNQ